MTEIRLDAEPDEPADGGEHSPGSPRSRWITAYAVALAVLAVAIVSFVEVVGGDPDDVVTDYLSAVHDGDTDAALELATVKPKKDDPRDVFLRRDVLRANWRITTVTTRSQAVDKAIVDASVAGPDGERDGVFRLELSRTGDWRITNPFVPLYLTPPPLWKDGDRERVHLNLNGATMTVPDYEPAGGVTESAGIQLRLYPGTYEFFDGDDLVKPIDAARTWLPPGDSRSFVPYTPLLELTAAANRLVDDRIGELLDDCADPGSREKTECPYGTDGSVTLDGEEHTIDDDEITWTVEGKPDLYYTDTGLGYFRPVERRPLTVELAVTVDGDTESVECSIDWGSLWFGLSTEATVEFAYPNDTPDTCA